MGPDYAESTCAGRVLGDRACPVLKRLSPPLSILLQSISLSTGLIQWHFGWRIRTSRR